MSRPLDPVEQWMLKQNIEYIKTQDPEIVIANLRMQGYKRVADALENIVKKTEHPFT